MTNFVSDHQMSQYGVTHELYCFCFDNNAKYVTYIGTKAGFFLFSLTKQPLIKPPIFHVLILH